MIQFRIAHFNATCEPAWYVRLSEMSPTRSHFRLENNDTLLFSAGGFNELLGYIALVQYGIVEWVETPKAPHITEHVMTTHQVFPGGASPSQLAAARLIARTTRGEDAAAGYKLFQLEIPIGVVGFVLEHKDIEELAEELDGLGPEFFSAAELWGEAGRRALRGYAGLQNLLVKALKSTNPMIVVD